MKLKPYNLLSDKHKEKFKTVREYLDFLRDITIPDMKSKEVYLKNHKAKVEEGAEWIKEFYRFYRDCPAGFRYIFNKKEFTVRTEFLAFSHVRQRMLKKRMDLLNLEKITQADSNHLTRRAKVSYLVFMEMLSVRNNVLFDMQSVPQKVVSFSEAIKLFDREFIRIKDLVYPRRYGDLTEDLLKNVMGYN